MTQDHSLHDQEAEQAIVSNIEKYGYHLSLLEADEYLPAFVYTIGLYKTYGHPEIICVGLQPEVMQTIIDIAAEMIKAGETLTTNKNYDEFLEGYPIQFLQVDKDYYRHYVGYACWYYHQSFDFPLLQLVWPDKQSFFPWEQGFNQDWKFTQPLLDRNTGFKFFEERNLGVFTTQEVLDGAPILFVYHDEDGDWQFYNIPTPAEADVRMVCLEDIVKRDPSVNAVHDLRYGWQAWRTDKESDWELDQ